MALDTWTQEGLSDEALIDRFAENDLDALEQLYDRHHAAAFGLALRMLGDRGLAEDVLQDAMFSAWRRASTFRPERGSARTWLLGIVRNRAIDMLRSRSGAPCTVSLDLTLQTPASIDIWQDVSRVLDADSIRAILNGLPNEQRTTIELAYFRGLTCVEIAERMQVPVGTVKGRLRLALKKLRTALVSMNGAVTAEVAPRVDHRAHLPVCQAR